jgi:hypothetical protein
MKPKKTIQVEELKRYINEQLKNPLNSVEYKYAIGSMLETFLHSTGNYKGFMFLDISEPIKPDTQKHATRKYY